MAKTLYILRDKVNIVAELYWQLTCAQRDEFLRETENN